MNDDYQWPEDGDDLARRARATWNETVSRLSIGDRITGTVVGRQHFGVFLTVNEVVGAMAEAEIVNIPNDMELPRISESVTGKVIGFDGERCQIFVTIDND